MDQTKYPRGFYGDASVKIPRLPEDADMNARIERVTHSMLDGDLTLPIMLRFTTAEMFNKFIRKVLVMGNVKQQPHDDLKARNRFRYILDADGVY